MADDGAPASGYEFTVAIDVSRDGVLEGPDALEAPFFRFEWKMGGEVDRITTDAMPMTEGEQNEWTLDEEPEAAEPELDEEGNPIEVEAPEPTQAQAENWGTMYHWTKSWSVGSVDRDFAVDLNADPIVTFTLGDSHAEKPTQCAAGSSQEGEDDDSEKIPGRNYITQIPIDLSAMLGGETRITQSFAVFDAGNQQRIMPVPPKGMRRLNITISVNQKLLSPDLEDELNPLMLNLKKAVDLPGVVVTSRNMEYCLDPTPYNLLEKYCQPVYATYKFFDNDNAPRIVRTAALPHGPTVKWEHSSCFLAGDMDKQELEEHLESTPLKVEIHDRDLNSDQERQWHTKAVSRWERMIVGGRKYSEDELEEMAKAVKAEAGADGDEEAAAAAAENLPSTTEAMDIFDVDKLAAAEMAERFATSGQRHSHAVASFRLADLLSESKLLQQAYLKRTRARAQEEGNIKAQEYLAKTAQAEDATANDVVLKLQADVFQAKRRAEPKNKLFELDLSAEERLVLKPGSYLDHGCQITMMAWLAHPVRTLQESKCEGTGASEAVPTPFTRMVVTFNYHNSDLLRTIMDACDTVNKKTLTGVSLRSYQLTEQEQEASDGGSLDIVTGIQVIDDDYRMIIIEGLAEAGMKVMGNSVPRIEANNPNCTVLWNPSVHFKKRLYTRFDVDLKKIKLRDPLPVISKSPDIYHRTKVSELCFEALHRLCQIREANRMIELKEMGIFPVYDMLIEMENKYGESISVEDIEGSDEVDNKGATVGGGYDTLADTGAMMKMTDMATVAGAAVTAVRIMKKKFKAPTDQINAAFMKAKRDKVTRDFIAEQKTLTAKTVSGTRAKLASTEVEPELEARYVYSGQKLQYTEMKKREMRDKLAGEKKATFTYSADFQSLSVQMVDEGKLKRDEEAAQKAQWVTKRGFVYPAPKPPSEFNKHAKAPDASRVEELQQPWVENENHPAPVSRDDMLEEGKPQFDSLPAADVIFGGVSSDGTPDPDFFKSVFLSGDSMAAEAAAARKKEQDEWNAKVVVDNLRFTAHGNTRGNTANRPSQLDKATDVLAGKPSKKSMKILRSGKLPSGKSAKFIKAPVTIHNVEEYTDPRDFTADLRKDHVDLFTGRDPETGKTVNFKTHIHAEEFIPKSKKIQSKKSAKTMNTAEMTGPRWGTVDGSQTYKPPPAPQSATQ